MGSSGRFEARHSRTSKSQKSSIINKLRPAAFPRRSPRHFSLRQRHTSVLVNVHDVNKSSIESEERRKSYVPRALFL